MRPRKLRMRGVGPFKDIEIDFAAVPGSIIAISGLTGQGKTMTIESIFAGHHRGFPSRPESIYKYCHGKDACIELEFTNKGISYRSLINIDAVGSEMESFLFEGSNPLNDGKAKTFKEVVTRLFGSESLILSSSFSAQNHKGSFISLAKADRKSLFIAMINQIVLEKISRLAKDSKEICDREYESLSAKLESFRQIRSKTIPDLDEIRKRIDEARQQLLEADGILRENQGNLSMEKAKIETGAGAGEKKKSLQSKEYLLSESIKATTVNLSSAKTMATSLESLQAASEGIEEETEKLRELKVRVEIWRLEVSEQEQMENDYLANSKQIQGEIAGHQKTEEVSRTKLDQAQKDSKIIKAVPCKAEGEYAKCQFLVNAVAGKESIDPLTGAIDGAKAQCLALAQKLNALVKPTSGVKDSLRRKINEENPKMAAAEVLIRQKNEAKARIPKAEAAAERVSDLENQLEQHNSSLVVLSEAIAQLEAEDKELEQRRTRVRSLQSKVDLQEELIESIRHQLSSIEKELSQAELLAQQFEQAGKEMDPIVKQIERSVCDRRSWDLLAKSFGKTGIQSLEIDVAGPEVSAIANDLLFSCFGPRFSIKFRTQKPLADGSGFTDDFDIYVHDQDRGEWGGIDDLSGGEKVVVSEAVSLAIALYNRQKSNIGWETIYRDEPSSALDDENAPRYVTMLRKARELGHFEILYLISHQNSVKELADSRINISKGEVSIQA